MLRTQIISLVCSVLFLGMILLLVRKRRLDEGYSLLWLLLGAVLVLLSLWPRLLDHIAAFLGIITPANALWLIGHFLLSLILLHFSLVITRLTRQNLQLAQDLALVREELSSRRAAGAQATE